MGKKNIFKWIYLVVKKINSFLNIIFFDSDLKEGMKGVDTTAGEVRWIGTRNPYGPTTMKLCLINGLGFEYKPEEKICKNTGHFLEKDWFLLLKAKWEVFAKSIKNTV